MCRWRLREKVWVPYDGLVLAGVELAFELPSQSLARLATHHVGNVRVSLDRCETVYRHAEPFAEAVRSVEILLKFRCEPICHCAPEDLCCDERPLSIRFRIKRLVKNKQ
jgi:hypothetical protein